jgi:uncharacterized membrane protein YagU involved in acid resistance
MNKIVAGTLAGLTATAPMTAAMVAMHKALPAHERYPLPPRKVTMRAAKKAGVKKKLRAEPEKTAATLAAHFGYGAAMGGIFALLAPRAPGRPVAKGVTWGLIVWATSYLGLLPATGLHEPATRHPRERNLLMILAHVIWGGSLGLLLSRRVR